MRLIGDIHGDYDEYLRIIGDCEESLQLGDFGFDYSCLSEVDPNKHKILLGNHDNYDWDLLPHFLSDFGYLIHKGFKVGYMRGAASVDALTRVREYLVNGNKIWWYEEELSDFEMCIEFYEKIKPDIMITHDCPSSIVWKLYPNVNFMRACQLHLPTNFTSRTQMALECMFQIHQPKQWYFAHWHLNWTRCVDGTNFTCIDTRDYLDI